MTAFWKARAKNGFIRGSRLNDRKVVDTWTWGVISGKQKIFF